MNALRISELAAALRTAHGDKAPVEAARRKREYEAAGNRLEAENWQRIFDALTTTAAPHQG